MALNLQQLKLHTKIYVCIVIIGLTISGLTAFPLETELAYLAGFNKNSPHAFGLWLTNVYLAIKNTNRNYPFLSYGTDWLAFAHLMLAILFVGPLKNPVKNKWVIQFGIICCILIIPLALIAGGIRQVPIFWRLIDCSFGIIGIVPLLLCLRNINLINTKEAKY